MTTKVTKARITTTRVVKPKPKPKPLNGVTAMPDDSVPSVQRPLPSVGPALPTTMDGAIDIGALVMRQAVQDTLFSGIRKLRRMGISLQRIEYSVSAPDPEAGGNVLVEEV